MTQQQYDDLCFFFIWLNFLLVEAFMSWSVGPGPTPGCGASEVGKVGKHTPNKNKTKQEDLCFFHVAQIFTHGGLQELICRTWSDTRVQGQWGEKSRQTYTKQWLNNNKRTCVFSCCPNFYSSRPSRADLSDLVRHWGAGPIKYTNMQQTIT